MNTNKTTILIVLLCTAIAGCNSTTVKTTTPEKIVQPVVQIPEGQLLDVGIGIFNPGIDELSTYDDEAGVRPSIRKAEARFMPYKLMETLQHTGNWGVVRVIPDRQSEMDVWVDAEILKSDGENLELQVIVEDSSGRIWFTRKYTEVASKFSYDDSITKNKEAFQGLYNRIANDMLAFHAQLSATEIKTIRTITELKFAKDFSPQAFEEHLAVDKYGNYSIKRLPAENDPTLLRIKQIRERDYMFVDTLQEYYAAFVREMEQPYKEWRKAVYEEGRALREVKSQSTQRMIGGALAVLAGILAQGSDSPVTRTAGAVGIGAGAGVFMSGLNKSEEAKLHSEALEEISASLGSEIEPHTMNLENHSVTLSGSVNEQYDQWRQILKEIYQTETGQL